MQRPLTVLCVLLALQGVVGLDQYETHLPTELVWVHVALACVTWLSTLWAALCGGPGWRLPPSSARRAGASGLSGPAHGWRRVGLAGRARRSQVAAQVPRKLGLLSAADAAVWRAFVLTSG